MPFSSRWSKRQADSSPCVTGWGRAAASVVATALCLQLEQHVAALCCLAFSYPTTAMSEGKQIPAPPFSTRLFSVSPVPHSALNCNSDQNRGGRHHTLTDMEGSQGTQVPIVPKSSL
jgi:hypothetical protein